MAKPKKDCSAEFHRAKRKEREKKNDKPVDIGSGAPKIGEGKDHAKKRAEYFKKIRGL